jgi:competence protein ComEC
MRYFLPSHPALRLLCCAVAGILLAMALPAPPAVWLAVTLTACLPVAVVGLSGTFRSPLRQPISTPLVPLYLLAVVSAFALHASSRYVFVPSPSLLSWVGRDVIISGEVEGRPEAGSGGTGFKLHASEVFQAGRTVMLDDRAQVFIRSAPGAGFPVQEGEFVRVKGRPGLIATAANLGEYDPRRQARYRGIHVQLFCPGPWCMLRESPGRDNLLFRSLVNPARRYLAGSIDGRFPPGREGAFVKGMVLGEQELLPGELSDAFRRTGTAHVIAVSGLHVALLALAITLFLQRLKVTTAGRWMAFLLFVLVLTAYCFVTGNAPSIRRAAIMSAVMIGGGVLGRRTYALNSLAVSDLLILLLDPFDLYNAGFLMTNGAVVGILTLHGPLSRLVPVGTSLARRVAAAAWNAFSISLSAMAGVSPVIALFFGTFSVSGIIANLPVVFFSNLAMYAALPVFLFHGLAGWAASLFALSSWLCAKLTLFFTLFFSRLPLASVELRPDLVDVAIFYGMLGLMMLFGSRRSWGRTVIAMLLGMNLLFWHDLAKAAPKPPGILTVNLGKEVAVLFSSGGETVLVDAGRRCTTWERICRQADLWGMARPTSAVGFISPDSVVHAMPVSRRLDSSGRTLVLRSAVITRLADRVVRIDSRKRSILLVSGMGRLMETRCDRTDVVMIWMYRFTGRQWRQLDSWIERSKPGRVLLVEGSFMSAAQRALLARYARSRKGVSIRLKTIQTAWR